MSTSYPILIVKAGSEVHLKNRHHAIYKSAVAEFPKVESGAIVEVQSHRKEFLCYATVNTLAYICARAIAFEKSDPLEQVKKNIASSIAMRRAFFRGEDTTACRLINAEGDGIPGIIVDQYGSTLVLQLTTMGMDTLRDWVCDVLMDIVKPIGIFEKSTGQARKKEGLGEIEGWVRGKGNDRITITERGLQYVIALQGSQKTGLFLDQREMRSLVRQMAKDRTVLDCCSYVGGFSLNALAGGALTADAVDYDATALERAKEHIVMNGIESDRFKSYSEDVFSFLRRRPANRPYDFIILDPPAFAKRSSDIDQAKKAYTDLNRLALEILQPGGVLITCSCSYQIDRELFQTIVFHAARQAKRFVRIIERHRQAADHPINLYHPENDYLKSLVLWVE